MERETEVRKEKAEVGKKRGFSGERDRRKERECRRKKEERVSGERDRREERES